MQRIFTLAALAAIAALLSVTDARAMMAGSAPGIHQALAETSAVEKVVRVCRHQFFKSNRVCYVDRSRPPTVCHHIRSTSRRDCY